MTSGPLVLPAVGLPLLRRLRWLTLGALALAMTTAPPMALVELRLPLTLLGAAALSNAALYVIGARAARPQVVFAVMVIDTALLTGLLHLTGGPMNPFTALYFVHIALGAVLLSRLWVGLLLGLSAGGFALLFVLAPHAHMHGGMAEHLRGMWIAFAVAAGLIAYFVSRLALELRRRDAELAAERERAARGRRVAALTSLAASAAHELGTPIGSILLAAGELEELLGDREVEPDVLEDVQVIRREARRCREILDGLAVGAGELPGESIAPVTLAQLGDAALARIRTEEAARVAVRADDARVEVPPTALAIAIASLLRNALEVDEGAVTLDASVGGGGVTFRVEDHGPGMDPEVLARVGEPFNTAKDGQGLGLGLFLVHTLAQQLEGRLDIDSSPGAGTSVRLVLPPHRVVA
ncbi:MAG: HAMP domain-containing sensor histidine kinase [Sandaracinaceae bacterium]